MASHEMLVLWREEDWRCEFHPSPDGNGRLEVYWCGEVVTAETTLSHAVAEHRGEILRQRVLRGDLRAND
jgi:hypothetical protein